MVRSPAARPGELTHVTGNLEQPAWSPDGHSIAFLFVENATRHAGALDAMPPWNGVIGEDHVEIQRVYSVDSTSGKGDWLTLPPTSTSTPSSTGLQTPSEIAFIGANPPGENTWWIAKLYRESITTHTPNVVLDPVNVSGPLHRLQIAVPRWSPDGKRIALIGGLMSDQGSTGGDLWLIDANGGAPIDITPNIDGTPLLRNLALQHRTRLRSRGPQRSHTLLVDWNPNTRTRIASTDLGTVSLSGGAIKDAINFSSQQ